MDSVLYYSGKTTGSFLTFSVPIAASLLLGIAFLIAIYLVFKYVIIPSQLRHAEELKELAIRHLNEKSLVFMEAVEKERKRIAMDLHDNIIQSLSAANIRIETLKTSDAENVRPLNEISGIITNASSDIRQLIRNIIPTDLSTLGIEDALKNYIRSIKTSSGINYIINLGNFPGRFDLNTNLMIYRILQEVVNNIEKHSGATEASVTAVVKENFLTLNIADNGKGFNSIAKDDGKKGFGLLNMEYRVSLLNGELNITSEPGKGTTIVIKIPLARKEEPARA